MAKCDISIEFEGSAEDLVQKAELVIEDAGGTFSGDSSKGAFSVPIPLLGKIKGTYTISGQVIHILITDKPLLITCGTIEKELKKYLGQVTSLALEVPKLAARAAKCDISIEFEGSAEDLVQKAELVIEDAGGTFSGDSSKGAFSVPTPLGKIKGTYTISGQVIHILITDKPLLVTCGTIEKELKKYLGQVISLTL